MFRSRVASHVCVSHAALAKAQEQNAKTHRMGQTDYCKVMLRTTLQSTLVLDVHVPETTYYCMRLDQMKAKADITAG